MFPTGAALKHPFGIDDFDVRIPGGPLHFGRFPVGVGDDMSRLSVHVQSDPGAEAFDPQSKVRTFFFLH